MTPFQPRRFFFFVSAILLLLVILPSKADEARAEAMTPDAILKYLDSLTPLRTYESFPFTREEYREVAGGESVFKARKVPGSEIAEGGVARIVNAPAWKIWRNVVDEFHHSEFMPQIFFATVLKGQGTGRLIFDFLEIPLLSDRQWVVVAKHWGGLWKASGGRIWLASFDTPPDQEKLIADGLKTGKIPNSVKELQDDTVTIRESRGAYTLIELPDGRTLVEYRAYTDPAGAIPAWILNSGAPTTAKRLVKVLEERSQSSDAHFAKPGHPLIHDPLDRPMGQSRPEVPAN